MNDYCLLDSDTLVGIIHEEDLLHQRCLNILDFINQNDLKMIVAYPLVLEAATALGRRMNHPDMAAKLLSDFSAVKTEEIEFEVGDLVAKLYDPQTSKKNTPFDHYVLALAKKNEIKYIFSFDDFYKKNGLTLLEELL